MKKFIIFLIFIFAFGADINPFETNITKPANEINSTQEINSTENNQSKITPKVYVENFEDSFKTITPTINVAVVIDKKFFKKYLPSIINSLNAYFLYKNVNYTIQVFDEKNLINALNYKYIFLFAINPNIINSLNFQNNFYLPIIYKSDTNKTNIYFGGIDYKEQIDKLAQFIEKDKKITIINSDTYISQKLTQLETKEFNVTIMKYPRINYYKLKNSYIFFNTAANKTAQILSNINYKNIKTDLQFSTQVNYDPLLIEITQPQDVQKLIIASSIANVPNILEDYNQLLNSDIEFNWLNYSTTLLANKIYNQVTNDNEYYLNDFKIYMFNNQINYKTKLYQIIDNSFRKVY